MPLLALLFQAQDTIVPGGAVGSAPLGAATNEVFLRLMLGMVVLIGLAGVSIVALRRLRQLRKPIVPTGAAPGSEYTPHFDGMSAREAQFYAMTMGARRPTPPGVPRPTPRAVQTIRPAAAERNGGDHSASQYSGPVHCPACGTLLGVAGPMLQYVTRCPACSRWVSTRLEGDRITIESRER